MAFLQVHRVTKEEAAAYNGFWQGCAILAKPTLGDDLVILTRGGMNDKFGPLINLGTVTGIKAHSGYLAGRYFLVTTSTLEEVTIGVGLLPDVNVR